jgi:hypothetical protein
MSKYQLSFRIFHPSIDPVVISHKLGILPRYQWMVGSQKKTPKGVALGGTYTSSYWCCDVATSNQGLNFALQKFTRKLVSHRQFLLRLAQQGSLEYFIGIFAEGESCGEVLGWEILKAISELQIKLSLDIYGSGSKK